MYYYNAYRGFFIVKNNKIGGDVEMKRKLLVFLSAVMMTSVFAGCGAGSSSGSDSETIKVGVNYELSGAAATYGQSMVSGIELAFEEINKDGGLLGKQVEIVKVDNKSENAESANLATKLATKDKVIAILGASTSSNTKAAAVAATTNKVPLISASATSDDATLDKNGKVLDYVFKTCFSNSFQGTIMGQFSAQDLGKKNAAVLMDSGSDYAKGLSNNFKETFTSNGGTIVAEEAYAAKQTDFKAVLTNIKSSGAEVIYVPGYYEEVGLIIKQARELGIDAPIVGGDGFDSPKLSELAGTDALNNIYYTNHYSSMDDTPEVVKFKEAYKAKYDKDADTYGALGYDLAYFLADSIDRAGEVDREKLRTALEETKDFKGITGQFSMDENHTPRKSITVLEIENGETTFLKKLDPQ